MDQEKSPARTFCMNCGEEIPSWFEKSAPDDVAYNEWLQHPCAKCGKSPKDLGAA